VLALRATQIELQAGLCDERNVPGLQIPQGVEQIEHRPAPAPEIRFLTPEEDQQLTDLAEDIAQQMLGPDWKERQEQRRAALNAKNVPQ
jgi:hypothetical protein